MFEFQRKNGHEEFLTENAHANGYAQVASSKCPSGGVVFNIIIDKELIFSLVCDAALEKAKESETSDFYNSLVIARKQAKNALCHEFVHIHTHKMDKTIEWMNELVLSDNLQSHYLSLAIGCWNQYLII